VLSGAEVAIVGCRPPRRLEHCRTDALALTVSKQGRRVAKYHTAAVWLSTAKIFSTKRTFLTI